MLIAGGIVFLSRDPQTHHPARAAEFTPEPKAVDSTPPSGERRHPRPEKALADEAWEDQIVFENFAVQSLRKLLGDTLSTKKHYTDLMRFRDYLMTHHSENWEVLLDRIVSKAFPETADEILRTLSLLDEYHDWLKYSNEMLSELSYREMKEALLNKRMELFGEEAAGKIWEGETGIDHIRDTLAIMEEAYTTTIEEKLNLYTSALMEERQDGAENLSSYLSGFLNMESVQDELKQMSPAERAQSLREIRRTLGYSDKIIEKLESMDAYREQRWENGLSYMRDREMIFQNSEGAEIEEALKTLREQYFGREASTIEAEEASGFFRYRRRRVYGRN